MANRKTIMIASRTKYPRMAKAKAAIPAELPFLKPGKGVEHFFGCYSEEEFDSALKKMEKNEAIYNVGRNHHWSKRLEELSGLNFTHDIRLALSEIHGFGLFCHEQIRQDEIIIEYTGEIISKFERDKRDLEYKARGIQECYFVDLDDYFVVDGTRSANMCKYINHSCNPNTILEVIQVEQVKRVVVSALRTINPTEELTFDYKFAEKEDPLPCLCKSSNCRGFVNLI